MLYYYANFFICYFTNIEFEHQSNLRGHCGTVQVVF